MPQQAKPNMPTEGITKKVKITVPVNLARDFDRFANGTMLMSVSEASFTFDDGRKGSIRCSVGGESVEINFGGSRSWNIKLGALVEAALKAEKIYQKEVL